MNIKKSELKVTASEQLEREVQEELQADRAEANIQDLIEEEDEDT